MTKHPPLSDHQSAASEQPCENTDRELWRERDGDYYSPSVFVTTGGGLGMNVGGTCIVKPIRDWHRAALSAAPLPQGGDEGATDLLKNAQWIENNSDWLYSLAEDQTCSDLCDKTFEQQGCPYGTCARESGLASLRKFLDDNRRALASSTTAPMIGTPEPTSKVSVEPTGCEDCDRQYGDEHGFPDLIIPYDAWKQISTGGDDSGLLCPSCICKRLADKGIKCEAAFMSGPVSISRAEMHLLLRIENIELAIDGRDNRWSGVRKLMSRPPPPHRTMIGTPYDHD